MTLFRNKYRSASTRLKNWDYRNAGAYFITICCKDRECFFGEVKNEEMQLNEIGKMAEKYWLEIPGHFKNVRLGEFVIMPNHMHGILILNGESGGGVVETLQCNVSTETITTTNHGDTNPFMSDISPKPGSVSTIIRSYKSVCTKNINQQHTLDFAWQPRFHDHVIRNHMEYSRIENYIIYNPKNWKEDRFH